MNTVNKVDFSFIIPVYNAGEKIEKMIETLLMLKYPYYEIIIVNDGSTDDSEKYILKYLSDKIHYYKKENEGVSVARNFGFSKSIGEYILFFDGDDYIDSDNLDKVLKDIKDKAYDLSFFGLIDVFQEKNSESLVENYISDKLYKTKESFLDEFGYLLNQRVLYSPCNKIYKSEIIRNNNIVFKKEYKLGEDILFNLDYFKYLSNVKFYKENIYYYIHYYQSMNTGSSRYYDNHVQILNDVFEGMKQLLILNNKWEENKSEVHGYIIRSITAVLNSLTLSNLSKKEKIDKVNEIYTYDIFNEAISNDFKSGIENKQEVLINKCLNEHKINKLLFVYQMKMMIKKRLYPVFKMLKKV